MDVNNYRNEATLALAIMPEVTHIVQQAAGEILRFAHGGDCGWAVSRPTVGKQRMISAEDCLSFAFAPFVGARRMGPFGAVGAGLPLPD